MKLLTNADIDRLRRLVIIDAFTWLGQNGHRDAAKALLTQFYAVKVGVTTLTVPSTTGTLPPHETPTTE